MRRSFVPVIIILACLLSPALTAAEPTLRQYLSGCDKDSAVPWQFFCSAGRQSGQWTTIPVPSNWECHGFGEYTYWSDGSKTAQGKYPNYDTLKQLLAGPDIYFPTEFLHGLYDGGAGAGLADFWDAMRGSKVSAGGFIWALLDEGVDKQGKIDVVDNKAPDGIVGPYRQKEGSFNAIKEI